MDNFWNYFLAFLSIVTGHVFGKFVTDSLPDNIGIQVAYKFSKKVLWRLSLVALLGLLLFAIKLKVPSEQQKIAFLVTAVVIGWVLHIQSKNEEKTVKEIEE